MTPEEHLRGLKDDDRWLNLRVPRATPARSTASPAPPGLVSIVAGFVVAIVAVTAIVLAFGSLHRPAPPAATASAPTSPSSDSSPAPSIVLGATHRWTATTQPAPCALGRLQTASTQDGGGAGGSYLQRLYVRNDGPDCLLEPSVVRVGNTVAKLSGLAGSGQVLPAEATATLDVTTASACPPDGAKNNVDLNSVPSRPISLDIGGASRTMTALFPTWTCVAPLVEATLDPAAAAPFSTVPPLTVTIGEVGSQTSPAGVVTYTASIVNTGSRALVLHRCPTATEVVTGGREVVTTGITLRCTPGTRLEPDVPVVVESTAVALGVDEEISWFFSPLAATETSPTTCSSDQLRITERGEGGGETGDFWQQVLVENRGPACILPATAFSAGGRIARGGTAASFRIGARATTQLLVGAAVQCADGSSNTSDIPGGARSPSPEDKPILVTLGGRVQVLTQPFPALRCEGPFVDRG